jgi:hypothetical protein
VSGGAWEGRPPGEIPSGEVWEGRPPGEAPASDGASPELRELVREVLRDVLPGLTVQNGHNRQARPPLPAAPPAPDSMIVESSGQIAHKSLHDHGRPSPELTASPGSPAPWPRSPASQGVTLRPVRLATDAELHEFVLHILALADNPKRRRDLLAGRLRFTLASATAAAPTDHRVEKGAVTERAVQAAAAAGARLVLGPRAVLTPLARDRARALGVPIEKER